MRAALLFCLAAPLAGQAPSAGSFVVRLGRDTLGIEQYRVTGTRIEGDILGRGQVVTQRHFTLTLAPNGTVSALDMSTRQPGNPTAPTVHTTWTTTGDTTVVVLTRGDSSRTLRVATPGGVLPYLGWSAIMFERYLAFGKAQVPVLSPGDAQPFAIDVARIGKDSATVTERGEAGTRVGLDAAGRALSIDGSATTEKHVATRVDQLDVAALAAAFANRPLGALSPSDSVQATIGGGSLQIVYSRPSLRGRVAMGGVLVPWNQVWRTGANAATRLTTSTDLTVAGQKIPAGAYTLFTLPRPTGWTLIFSKQTKAPCQTAAQCADPNRRPLWGTDYSPDSDLVRVEMQVATQSPPVEQFTITLTPRGDAVELGMAWERTVTSVELRKR